MPSGGGVCLAEISGSWADGDDNGRRDVGENISFDVDIANKGTVTLQVLKIMDDSSGSATCTRSESLLLRQEERHKCTGRRQVGTKLNFRRPVRLTSNPDFQIMLRQNDSQPLINNPMAKVSNGYSLKTGITCLRFWVKESRCSEKKNSDSFCPYRSARDLGYLLGCTLLPLVRMKGLQNQITKVRFFFFIWCQ